MVTKVSKKELNIPMAYIVSNGKLEYRLNRTHFKPGESQKRREIFMYRMNILD